MPVLYNDAGKWWKRMMDCDEQIKFLKFTLVSLTWHNDTKIQTYVVACAMTRVMIFFAYSIVTDLASSWHHLLVRNRSRPRPDLRSRHSAHLAWRRNTLKEKSISKRTGKNTWKCVAAVTIWILDKDNRSWRNSAKRSRVKSEITKLTMAHGPVQLSWISSLEDWRPIHKVQRCFLPNKAQ